MQNENILDSSMTIDEPKQEHLYNSEDFNKKINISYLDSKAETESPPDKLILRHYCCSLIVYAAALAIIFFNNWYSHLLTASVFGYSVKEFFYGLYLVYAVAALPILFAIRPKSLWNSTNILIFEYFSRVVKAILGMPGKADKLSLKPSYKEQQAILLLMVKLYFGPQMVQYASNDINIIARDSGVLLEKLSLFAQGSLDMTLIQLKNARMQYLQELYPFLITVLFFIDTFFFAIGYLTEAAFLGNKVRQVENTFLGIAICIICYPPFNNATTAFLNWYQKDNAACFDDPNSVLTWTFRITALSFLFIYACASIALFTRASNLTNRGTVTRWPYNMVRHPAYLSKNMFWWLTTLPFFFKDPYFIFSDPLQYIMQCFLVIVCMVSWNFIYYMRAITEERLLMRDPEYQEYAKRVKYRFIPGIW